MRRWIWSLFSSSRLADEAAEREEYGFADRGRTQLERERFGHYETEEAARAALDELDAFKPPPLPQSDQ
jgi:hypothetical protein